LFAACAYFLRCKILNDKAYHRKEWNYVENDVLHGPGIFSPKHGPGHTPLARDFPASQISRFFVTFFKWKVLFFLRYCFRNPKPVPIFGFLPRVEAKIALRSMRIFVQAACN
jgi:hypothetical protein